MDYKKRGPQQPTKENETGKEEEKNGIDNKAFEEEKNKTKTETNQGMESINQSQIEMGFTESMLCTSKL